MKWLVEQPRELRVGDLVETYDDLAPPVRRVGKVSQVKPFVEIVVDEATRSGRLRLNLRGRWVITRTAFEDNRVFLLRTAALGQLLEEPAYVE